MIRAVLYREEIIALYFARDEQAIRETDRSYGKACMQVSMNVLNSRPDAEECVNDKKNSSAS